jgi:uncharacterized protein YyaL (SSP411 family)
MQVLKGVLATAAEYGFASAPFALATRRVLEDELVTVHLAASNSGDSRLRPLARAAHALYIPFKLIRFLDPNRDSARLRQIKEALEAGPVAVVCRGTRCAPPCNEADAIVLLMAKASTL